MWPKGKVMSKTPDKNWYIYEVCFPTKGHWECLNFKTYEDWEVGEWVELKNKK